MESRLHPRVNIDVNVNISRQGNTLATARALDLSKGGVAIEPPDCPLDKGQILNVKLTRPNAQRSPSLRARAMVIYTGSDRIGLMFADQINF